MMIKYYSYTRRSGYKKNKSGENVGAFFVKNMKPWHPKTIMNIVIYFINSTLRKTLSGQKTKRVIEYCKSIN